MQFEHKPVQTSDYEMKIHHGQIAGYNQMHFQISVEEQNKNKVDKFKERLEEFKNIKTLAEAKEITQRIIPVKDGITVFRVGNAKCIIVNKEKILKITLRSKEEYINYSFI